MDFICLLRKGNGESATLYRCASVPVSILPQDTVRGDRSKAKRKGEHSGAVIRKSELLGSLAWSAAQAASLRPSDSPQCLASRSCSIFVLFLNLDGFCSRNAITKLSFM